MDVTVSVIFLLTGFCIPAVSLLDHFYFVNTAMTWFKARAYCVHEYTEMVQIWSVEDMIKLINTPVTPGFKGKAWIGLYQNTTKWYWTNGTIAPYYNWGFAMLDNRHSNEHCATINYQGQWRDADCQIEKPFVCVQGDGETYVLEQGPKNWTDAQIFCEASGSVLAYIPGPIANIDITALMSGTTEAWFGLSRPSFWLWSEGGRAYTYKNWEAGQPDNLYGKEDCAVLGVENGTWSDEYCKDLFPFFCYGAFRTWKKVVSIKIQSTANMENPLYTADLQEQLRATFADRGFTDIKLTWWKLPVMQIQKSTDDTGC